MKTVQSAEKHDMSRRGSTGNASYMLICQYQFPHTYADNDILIHIDDDHLENHDRKRFEDCLEKWIGCRGSGGLGDAIREMSPQEALAFLVELLDEDPEVQYTGYRVLVTTHRAQGYPVWSLEIFSKHPDSRTQVYDTENAPHLIPGSRY